MGEIKSVPEIIKGCSPYYEKKDPEAEHKLVYNSPTETLEPIYFYILDMLEDFGLQTVKYIDNFSSSPGSGYFQEFGMRASAMQQNAAKTMGDIQNTVSTLLRLLYDLKEIKMRVSSYDRARSGDENVRKNGVLELKQIWLDKVDINRGNSSIKAMAFNQQMPFQTLLDAFLAAEDAKGIQKLDLNERIKRVLYPRIEEFNDWIKESESELRKRYKIQRVYLKNQVNNLKLYSRWVKPYLRAAAKLEQKDVGRDPSLVTAFNTLILELVLLGKKESKVPSDVKNAKGANRRKYYQCVLVEFDFRGVPQKTQQQYYVFGGKVEVTFRGYALNEEELKKIEQELEKSDIDEAIQFIGGATDESLGSIQEEVDYFLNDDESSENVNDVEEKKKKKDYGVNPFLALLGAYNEKPKKKDEKKSDNPKEIVVDKDNWVEKNYIRKTAAEDVAEMTFTLFDVYKKTHGMASYT